MFKNDSLRIELNHAEVASGDTIVGRVILELEKSHKCTVRVDLAWRTTGKGNAVEKIYERKDFPMAEFKAGVHELSFEFQTPTGPFTYDGRNMGLEWFVQGRADIPWKIDPKASTIFKLIPGEVDIRPDSALVAGSIAGEIRKDAGANLLLAVLGIISFFSGIWLLNLSIFAGAVAILVGVALAVPLLARKPLEDIELTFEPTEVRAGEQLKWRAKYTAKPNIVINHAAVIFTCRESVTSGSRNRNLNVRTETLFQHEETLPLGAKAPFEGKFEVPHFLSFSTDDHSVKWWASLRIDIKRRPDFHEETEFMVLPPLKLLTAEQSTPDEIW